MKTTIQIKKTDKLLFDQFMKANGYKRSHEAFSELITYKKPTYKQEELISSEEKTEITLKPNQAMFDGVPVPSKSIQALKKEFDIQ